MCTLRKKKEKKKWYGNLKVHKEAVQDRAHHPFSGYRPYYWCDVNVGRFDNLCVPNGPCEGYSNCRPDSAHGPQVASGVDEEKRPILISK